MTISIYHEKICISKFMWKTCLISLFLMMIRRHVYFHSKGREILCSRVFLPDTKFYQMYILLRMTVRFGQRHICASLKLLDSFQYGKWARKYVDIAFSLILIKNQLVRHIILINSPWHNTISNLLFPKYFCSCKKPNFRIKIY